MTHLPRRIAATTLATTALLGACAATASATTARPAALQVFRASSRNLVQAESLVQADAAAWGYTPAQCNLNEERESNGYWIVANFCVR